ncbi:MAG TPA: flagellar biosynthesis protein FlgA [Deltaproteobacteria bacterium]|nr:MAG: flagellar biosynthesis protein FlgA [Deltaproteobacteria bacterium GWA2_55_82]OGQ62900.1 MAG: flagellar biosynthesis protein FlgA [Deltaproteobacteria bacterium RIFCSPLOWO2_02_FULL_55_12]OIJ72861.1 MAG: flagellar biosynthesis protein FlgA [Deltaproteobacteria bacterium GWC2_55_46]HBG46142.1 flagellar biosynthesis protein FlgA [Deltaproteobacteria bacterium]HCY11640.1 flagellar biosynthesis protein FlgA [Deltaproteobacteria bacterium]
MSGLFKILYIAVSFLFFSAYDAGAARIKDIAFIDGVRPNQLVGYGLVVGLSGTGDKSSAVYTTQSIANMLNKMGLKFDPKAIKVKNTAAVLVTAELQAFSKPGSEIDVVISSIGDATSLQGGTLIATPLKGHDGSVYAVAQGPLALAGFSAGSDTVKVSKNHQTAAKIPGGAIIEKEIALDIANRQELYLSLRNPDFTTAERVARSVNDYLGLRGVATAVDAGRIRLLVPEQFRNVVVFISKVEGIDVSPDAVTRVVVNERTGTVVMGEHVRISKVAVSHGDISIEIKTQYAISQPPPLSKKGETVVVPYDNMEVEEQKSRLIVLPESVTLGEVVRALNLVGVTPRDLVAILQAIKASGALQAELEII